MKSNRAGLVSMAAAMLIAAAILCACTSPGGAKAADVEGAWQLLSLGGTQELTPADPAVTTDITLAAGKASGSGGVNSFSGTYEAADGGKLSFGPLSATLMAGPAEAMAQESAFFSALEKTTSFEIYQGNLVLSDPGNNTLAVLAPK